MNTDVIELGRLFEILNKIENNELNKDVMNKYLDIITTDDTITDLELNKQILELSYRIQNAALKLNQEFTSVCYARTRNTDKKFITPSITENKPYTLNEVSRMFGKTRQTINRWMRKKTIPHKYVGDTPIFPRKEIDDILKGGGLS